MNEIERTAFEFFWEDFDQPIDTEGRCGTEMFDVAENAVTRLKERVSKHPNSANVVIEVTEGNYDVLGIVYHKGKKPRWFYALLEMLRKSRN